jgi:peptidoglycan/xylan/chitin deacetylase (PgdA/CDA1 family)
MRLVCLLFHDVFMRRAEESGFVSQAANRYKLSLNEFDRQLDSLTELGATPSLIDDLHQSTELHNAEGSEPEAPPRFVFTFDDGGLSYYTLVADRFEARGWRGHCFVPTDFIGKRGFLSANELRDLDKRGHSIGTHSASHPPRFSHLPADRMREEWSRSREALEDVLGHPVRIGSVPGGYFSNLVAATAGDSGLRVLMTSEPVTWTRSVNRCVVTGRFAVRCGAPADRARKFVMPAPWTRANAWAGWNAKGLFKPILGSSYSRIADWVHAHLA